LQVAVAVAIAVLLTKVVIAAHWQRPLKSTVEVPPRPVRRGSAAARGPMSTAKRWRHRWPTVLLVLMCGNAVVGNAAAVEPARCPVSAIAVPQWTATERDRVCAAAEAAVAFLRDTRFRYEGGLTIRPLQDPPAQHRGSEIGHFDIERREIQVLPLAAAVSAQRLSSAFAVPMTPALWASYVSHEVAHAVVERHFAPGVKRFTASEYIAAVVQLETMEPALRETILEHSSDLEAYPSTDAISSLY